VRCQECPFELSDPERRALMLLDEPSGILSRWPVGRPIALPMQRRGYVMNFSDFVLLTEAGREALRREEDG
jgi:hypothetical protein